MNDQRSDSQIVPSEKDDIAPSTVATFDYTQRHIKARFWARLSDTKIQDPRTITDAAVCRIAGSVQLADWLKDPVFRVWFFDEQYLKYKIAAHADKAIEVLVEILGMPIKNLGKDGSAKIKAAELLLKVGGLIENRSISTTTKAVGVQFADKDIQSMSESELKKFIETKVKKVEDGSIDS